MPLLILDPVVSGTIAGDGVKTLLDGVSYNGASGGIGADYNYLYTTFFPDGQEVGVPRWGTWSFTEGVLTVPYDQSWDLAGSSPTTYSVVSGALPTGLALSNVGGNIGRLSGTPTVAGGYTFTLRASNAEGASDRSFTLVIVAVTGGGENWHTFAC